MTTSKNMDAIKSEFEDWEKKDYDPALNKYGERKSKFETLSEIPVKPVYMPFDGVDDSYLDKLGMPGRYPFTRGTYAEGFRTRTWFVRGLFGFGTAEETNERMKFLREQGAGGLNIVFDSPTAWEGVDADHPSARGEVGKNGVAVNSLKDMGDLFKDLPIEKMNVTWAACAGASNVSLTSMYVALAQQRGLDFHKLTGAALNDVLSGLVIDTCFIPYISPEDSLKDWCDTVEHAILHMPYWYPTTISPYELAETGANPTQQLAYTITAAITYTRALMERGFDPAQIAAKFAVFFSCGNNFLEEIAKYRALRRMWARTFKEQFGVTEKKALQCRVHTQTSGLTLRAEQPQNNIVRASIQSLAAILGGTNSLYTDPYDEVYGLPSEESHRLALRTQQILIEETGVADTMDPFAGSYCIESLTDQLEAEAWKMVAEVENLGGMLPAIKQRYFRSRIDEYYHHYLRAVEKGEKIIVGHNKYTEGEDIPMVPFEVSQTLEDKQLGRVRAVRANRDQAAVNAALNRITELSDKKENVMDACIDAAKASATHGEMIAAICKPRESYENEFRAMTAQL